MYCDSWFTTNTPQMSLTAEALVGKYNLRIMATLIGDESPTPMRRSDGFDVWTKEIPVWVTSSPCMHVITVN